MSALSRFMHTARAVLDEQDHKATPNASQPPFYVRTTWLFASLEDLATPSEAEIFTAMKIARLNGDIAQSGRLVEQVHAASRDLEAPIRHQREQLCGWIKDQIKREGVYVN